MPGDTKQLLLRIQQGEKLDWKLFERLDREGLIETKDVSHMQTPHGQKDLLFIFFTDKGKQLLESCSCERLYPAWEI
jgi:hypothetical protein